METYYIFYVLSVICTAAPFVFPLDMCFFPLGVPLAVFYRAFFPNCVFLSLIDGTGVTLSRNDFSNFPCSNAQYISLNCLQILSFRFFQFFLKCFLSFPENRFKSFSLEERICSVRIRSLAFFSGFVFQIWPWTSKIEYNQQYWYWFPKCQKIGSRRLACFENKTKQDPFFATKLQSDKQQFFHHKPTLQINFQNSIKPNDSQNNFDNTALFHPPPSALFLLLCFSLICQSLGKTWSALFSKGSQETFPPNNSKKTLPPNFSHLSQKTLKNNFYQKNFENISPGKWEEKCLLYQTNLWKTCSTKNPWEKTSTKIASEKQICTQEISTPKKLKEHLPRISVQKPSLKKRDILHPKKSRWISITKKKKCT